MIKKLTEEQEAQIPIFRDKWLKIGLSTTPFTLEEARPIIDNLYTHLLGKKSGVPIIIMDSPESTWMAVVYLFVALEQGNQVLDQVGNQVRNQVWNQVLDQVWDQVLDQVRDRVGNQVLDQVRDQVWNQVLDQVLDQVRNQVGKQVPNFVWPYLNGNFSSGYFSWVDFFDQFPSISFTKTKWEVYKNTSKLSLIYPFDSFCVLCQKPKIIKMKNGQTHCEGGAAIEYPDGWSIWSLNGVNVPQWLAEDRDTEIKPEKIIEIENAEQRREFVRKVGYERIYYKLGGKTLDKRNLSISNGEEVFPHTYEVVKLEVGNGWTLLKMINPSLSTPDNPIYHLEGLPPDCDTVEKALNFRKPNWLKEYPVSEEGANWFQQGDVVIAPKTKCNIKPLPTILT